MAAPSHAQAPKHEMRGAWVTTVYNLDWPLSANDPPSVQQADLRLLFDELAASGINAVFFQIRSESDAVYASPFEPWSRYLTGVQGRAPNPFWDPLEEAIRLAHERGMELHAWMNPFRAISQPNTSQAANHVTRQRPEWILEVGAVSIINPGIPEAREYIVSVVKDVVSRYDVDGIHFDDYFYPYPPNAIVLEDEATYNQYGGGLSIEDWRRDNVNVFVLDVFDAIGETRPGVRFGISPFGIWKNGVPNGIIGLDAFNVVYADPLTWFIEESIDYLVPQLYWQFGGNQDFGTLADWWVANSEGIHIYPGIAAYKADLATAGGSPFSSDEIPAQISYSRLTNGIEGNVFFRSRNLGPANNQGLTARMRSEFYPTKAITPFMLYRDTFPPDAPTNLSADVTGSGVALRWDPALTGFAFANRWAIYRKLDDGSTPDPRAITNDAANLIHISWDPEWTDDSSLDLSASYHYVVTSLSRNSIESAETNLVTVNMSGTSVDTRPTTTALTDLQLYPNPVSRSAHLILDLERSTEIDIQIIDMLGRVVARPDGAGRRVSAGRLELSWDLSTLDGRRAAAGVYQVVVRTGRDRHVSSLVVLR